MMDSNAMKLNENKPTKYHTATVATTGSNGKAIVNGGTSVANTASPSATAPRRNRLLPRKATTENKTATVAAAQAIQPFDGDVNPPARRRDRSTAAIMISTDQIAHEAASALLLRIATDRGMTGLLPLPNTPLMARTMQRDRRPL
jgi:hypothetical protein